MLAARNTLQLGILDLQFISTSVIRVVSTIMQGNMVKVVEMRVISIAMVKYLPFVYKSNGGDSEK